MNNDNVSELPPTFQRLIRDVERTTGLTLQIWPGDWGDDDPHVSTWWARIPGGPGETGFIAHETMPSEDQLAEVIDYLQEQLLHEAIWGGWPICPLHNTHPLEAIAETPEGDLAWACPHGAYKPVRVGDLPGRG